MSAADRQSCAPACQFDDDHVDGVDQSAECTIAKNDGRSLHEPSRPLHQRNRPLDEAESRAISSQAQCHRDKRSERDHHRRCQNARGCLEQAGNPGMVGSRPYRGYGRHGGAKSAHQLVPQASGHPQTKPRFGASNPSKSPNIARVLRDSLFRYRPQTPSLKLIPDCALRVTNSGRVRSRSYGRQLSRPARSHSARRTGPGNSSDDRPLSQ